VAIAADAGDGPRRRHAFTQVIDPAYAEAPPPARASEERKARGRWRRRTRCGQSSLLQ
jgi:hypothetical protein